MGDVQISPFTIPVELLFFSWLEIRNKTGLACSTQLPPLSGYDKIHFLGWCSKHNTKRMCTQSLAFWLHPYKNWKSVTVFLKPLSFNYLTFYFFPACFLGSHIPPVTPSPGPIWLQRGSVVPGGDSVSEAGKLRYWAIHSQIPIVDWLWNRGITYNILLPGWENLSITLYNPS